ncbi:MAG: branched-chain amino acid transport system permease protein [Rhodobacteraceae bacterium HLUCCA12]|nr:MAG: branched-chain amino acid transport system permease protein [Rhodobacteraceae bacterium HLUCCA12]
MNHSHKRTGRDLAVLLVAVGLLGLLGLFVDDTYFLHVLILCFVWVIVVAAWDLVMGYAGILSFAQLALFAIGSYASAMLSINHGVPPLLAIPAGAVVTGVAGALIAWPSMRLRGEYIALFTFALHLSLPTLLEQGRNFGTGGARGLIGVPPLELGDFVLRSNDKTGWYFLMLGIAALVVYVIYFIIIGGRWGKAFVALRDSEPFARSLGINMRRSQFLIFTVSALVTGLGGALYAQYVAVITPRVLGNEFFLMVLIMLSVGGMGKYPGAILGAFIITIGNELLRDLGQFRLLLLGILVVAVMLWLPNGLADLRTNLSRLIRRKPSDAAARE